MSSLPATHVAVVPHPAPLTPRQDSLTRPPGAGLGIDIDEDVPGERHGQWWLPDPNWRHRTAGWPNGDGAPPAGKEKMRETMEAG